MVKGISRQVIVVNAPEPKLFEQAIFILRDNMGEGITDETLLKEARQIIRAETGRGKRRHLHFYGAFWAAAGAAAMGLAWVITAWIGYCG